MTPTGLERFWEEAAYVAALTEYLVINKSDTETDSEIVDILKSKPFMLNIVLGVLEDAGSSESVKTSPLR